MQTQEVLVEDLFELKKSEKVNLEQSKKYKYTEYVTIF